ncbi:hypothetical protein FOA52_008226 [Chlamydomonas sp. UWO 241]|nr:hypothetical protein FOA52_008226 [Chlamydomonas sp. UWO 241]
MHQSRSSSMEDVWTGEPRMSVSPDPLRAKPRIESRRGSGGESAASSLSSADGMVPYVRGPRWQRSTVREGSADVDPMLVTPLPQPTPSAGGDAFHTPLSMFTVTHNPAASGGLGLTNQQFFTPAGNLSVSKKAKDLPVRTPVRDILGDTEEAAAGNDATAMSTNSRDEEEDEAGVGGPLAAAESSAVPSGKADEQQHGRASPMSVDASEGRSPAAAHEGPELGSARAPAALAPLSVPASPAAAGHDGGGRRMPLPSPHVRAAAARAAEEAERCAAAAGSARAAAAALSQLSGEVRQEVAGAGTRTHAQHLLPEPVAAATACKKASGRAAPAASPAGHPGSNLYAPTASSKSRSSGGGAGPNGGSTAPAPAPARTTSHGGGASSTLPGGSASKKPARCVWAPPAPPAAARAHHASASKAIKATVPMAEAAQALAAQRVSAVAAAQRVSAAAAAARSASACAVKKKPPALRLAEAGDPAHGSGADGITPKDSAIRRRPAAAAGVTGFTPVKRAYATTAGAAAAETPTSHARHTTPTVSAAERTRLAARAGATPRKHPPSALAQPASESCTHMRSDSPTVHHRAGFTPGARAGGGARAPSPAPGGLRRVLSGGGGAAARPPLPSAALPPGVPPWRLQAQASLEKQPAAAATAAVGAAVERAPSRLARASSGAGAGDPAHQQRFVGAGTVRPARAAAKPTKAPVAPAAAPTQQQQRTLAAAAWRQPLAARLASAATAAATPVPKPRAAGAGSAAAAAAARPSRGGGAAAGAAGEHRPMWDATSPANARAQQAAAAATPPPARSAPARALPTRGAHSAARTVPRPQPTGAALLAGTGPRGYAARASAGLGAATTPRRAGGGSSGSGGGSHAHAAGAGASPAPGKGASAATAKHLSPTSEIAAALAVTSSVAFDEGSAAAACLAESLARLEVEDLPSTPRDEREGVQAAAATPVEGKSESKPRAAWAALVLDQSMILDALPTPTSGQPAAAAVNAAWRQLLDGHAYSPPVDKGVGVAKMQLPGGGVAPGVWDGASLLEPPRCTSPQRTPARTSRAHYGPVGGAGLVDVMATSPTSAARRRSAGRIDVSQFRPAGFSDSLVLSP